MGAQALMLPEAHLGHRTANRLRIRVPSQKGNPSYFSELKDAFSRYRKFEHLEVNPHTGSFLLIDENLDVGAVVKYAEEKSLFTVQKSKKNPEPLSQRLAKPVRDLSASLDRFTGGELDLPGMAFLALLSAGVYQILKGNFRSPPWYTAFWYALGIFTKSIIDKNKE
jgi:hypothetical protein